MNGCREIRYREENLDDYDRNISLGEKNRGAIGSPVEEICSPLEHTRLSAGVPTSRAGAATACTLRRRSQTAASLL